MKVRVLHHASIPIGSVLDVTPKDAEWWVRSGRGVIETAEAAAPENAALRTTKPHPRKMTKANFLPAEENE